MIPDVAPENREKSPPEDLTSALASDTVLGSKKKGKERAPCLQKKVQTCCARKDLSAAIAGEVEITPHGQPLQPKGLVGEDSVTGGRGRAFSPARLRELSVEPGQSGWSLAREALTCFSFLKLIYSLPCFSFDTGSWGLWALRTLDQALAQ